MALKMLHLLAYECEDGLLFSMCHTHNERDKELEEAQAEWKRIEGKGNAPCFAVDILMDEAATFADVKAEIIRRQQMLTLKSKLFEALATVLLSELLDATFPKEKKEADDRKNQEGPEERSTLQ